MARVPGTETPFNKAGLLPGQVVRFRRSRANGERGLADQRGFVTEVRPSAARVLLDLTGRGVWIESGSVLPEAELGEAALETLRQVFLALAGLRLEVDGSEWAIFTEGFDAIALDTARAQLGPRLLGLRLQCQGVHELAVRMELAPPL